MRIRAVVRQFAGAEQMDDDDHDDDVLLFVVDGALHVAGDQALGVVDVVDVVVAVVAARAERDDFDRPSAVPKDS